MEIINFILNIVVILLIFLVGLFTKNYLPSYMDKKGENLATKEDIKEITRKTEEVQREFKEEFEAFSSDMKFKYDFFYRQYSELYCKLYAIVIQSEYVRHFIQITDGRIITFDEAPFLEISPTHRETTIWNIGGEKAVVAAIASFFAIGTGFYHSSADKFFLYLQVNVLRNNGFVVAFYIVLWNKPVIFNSGLV